MRQLSHNEVKDRLKKLSGWRLDGGAITKDFEFKDFAQALDFMNQVGMVADKDLNHHPDWHNSYNKVSMSLTTHSVQGLTDKDFKLAKVADNIAAEL